jgi:hypothetical protein
MRKTQALVLLLSIVACVSACAGGKDRSPKTPSSPTVAVTPTASTGGIRAGGTFSTVSEFAHYYQQDVIAPIGVPLGSIQTEVAADGALEQYGYWILGGMGDLSVFGTAPASVADFDARLGHIADFVEVRRSIVQVHGAEALLIQERTVKYGYVDSFRLLWRQDQRLVQAFAASAGSEGRSPTVGPDALIAIANATRTVALSEVNTVSVLQEDRSAGPFGGQVSSVSSISDASRLFGGPVLSPVAFSFIHVLHAGVLKSYTIDIDDKGLQRVFLSPESPADVASRDPTGQPVGNAGGMDMFEKRDTPVGSSSLLFFSAGGRNLMIRDANGGSAAELESIALSIRSAVDRAAP